jgi:hypothetical protein
MSTLTFVSSAFNFGHDEASALRAMSLFDNHAATGNSIADSIPLSWAGCER